MPKQNSDKGGLGERLITLLLLLSPGIPLSREQIFEQMSDYYASEAAYRMLSRDLEKLRAQGFSIQQVQPYPALYQLERGKGPGSLFLFETKEVEGLALLHTLFSDPLQFLPKGINASAFPKPSPPHPFAQEILSLIDKLVAGLPEAQRRQFEQRTKKPYIFLHVQLAGDYLTYRHIMDFLSKAMVLGRQVKFSYLARENEEPREYSPVNPYFIEMKEEQSYLIASMESGSRIHFRLDRFVPESLELLPNSSKPMSPIRYHAIQFWIDEGLLTADRQGENRRVSERWHSQKIVHEDRENRRVLVEVETDDLWRAKKYFLSLGNHAVVISPEDLVRQLAEEIQQMARSYQQVLAARENAHKEQAVNGEREK